MLDFVAGWGLRQWIGFLVQLALFALALRLIVKLSDPTEPGEKGSS